MLGHILSLLRMGASAGSAIPVPPLPAASVSVLPASDTEGLSFTATVTLTGGLGPASVSYSISGDTDSITSPLSGTISVASGQPSGDLTITTDDDALDEPNATFTVTIFAPLGCTIGANAASSIILDDDDPISPPVANLSLSPASLTEGASFTATVTLTGGVGPASVDYAITGDTDDITSALTGTISIADGDPSASITITTDDDALAEASANFTVTISTPVDCILGATTVQNGVILDDDTASSNSILWGGTAIDWGGSPLTWG